MKLPKVPMAPINSSHLPLGPEWRYQIKWDGVRTLARLDGHGGVELFSKRIEPRNTLFPEIVQLLEPLRIGACMLDGEIAYFDGKRPNFQRVHIGVNKQKFDDSLIFVVFDLLYEHGEDIRHLPFIDRFNKLKKLLPEQKPRLLVSDLFEDGQALWDWLYEREWEGLISKQMDSPYVEGKGHAYWYKKRKELRLTVDVVGVKLKNGLVSSLMLRYKDKYIGHVSGLDQASKDLIYQFAQEHPGTNPFDFKPKYEVMWIAIPFSAKVSALEFTESGLLRQPKLLGFGV